MIFTLLAGTANALECGPHDALAAALDRQFKERPRAIATAGKNNAMIAELFVSEDGSWTLIITTTKGISCIRASGKHWDDIKPVAILRGDGT